MPDLNGPPIYKPVT